MIPFKIPKSSVVKNTARTALKGRWVEAIAVSCLGLFALLFVYLSASVARSLITEYSALVSAVIWIGYVLLLLAPLGMGIVRYFWRLTDSVCDEISEVFYYFHNPNRYFRVVKLTFILGWRVAAAAFVCMLPYLIVNAMSNTWLYQLLGQSIPIWAANLVLIESFLYVVGLLCVIVYISRYYLVPVIAVMDEELLLLEAVHISCMVSRKSSSAFICLLVSLLGWLLLTGLLVTAIYTLPLIISCYVVHCRFSIVNYNLILDYYENGMNG